MPLLPVTQDIFEQQPGVREGGGAEAPPPS